MFENIVNQLRRQWPGKPGGTRSLYVVLHRTAGDSKRVAMSRTLIPSALVEAVVSIVSWSAFLSSACISPLPARRCMPRLLTQRHYPGFKTVRF